MQHDAQRAGAKSDKYVASSQMRRHDAISLFKQKPRHATTDETGGTVLFSALRLVLNAQRSMD
jgi:hypothetical protein